MKIRLTACLLLASLAMSAHGQSNLLVGKSTGNTTVLPLWNSHNGQVDALLLIEPSVMPQLPSQRIILPAKGLRGNTGLQLRAGLSLEANPGMGVLCNNGRAITSVGSMAGHCMLVNLADQGSTQVQGKSAVNGLVQMQRSKALLTGSLGTARETLSANASPLGGSQADRRLLDSLLGPGSTTTLDSRNASLIGQVALGTQSWVSIGGTLARVRLIPTGQLRGGLPPEWNSSSLSVSGGVGNFGGEITGQMIEVPGQSQRFSTLGAGVSWRMPWKAKLSLGAENLVTHGKNPFGLPESRADGNEEGRVPYVRYQQDL